MTRHAHPLDLQTTSLSDMKENIDELSRNNGHIKSRI